VTRPRPLTARQREVLALVAAGRTAMQIGRTLGIEHTTVNRHLAEIYRALGAHDRAHAVALAIWSGDITLANLAAIGQAATRHLQPADQEPAA
jgi:DNA-binding CsgD family transcriptional regulator